MIYNVALVFPKEVNKQIYSLYETFKDKLNLDFGLKEYSIPHATIVKFETQKELNREELDELLNGLDLNLKVDLSGITFLPSHDTGCWIEISILKSQELINIQNELIEKLVNHSIKSGIDTRFRPHITLAKINDCKINLDNLDYSILRKKQIDASIVIGSADSNFEFYGL